MFVSMFPTAWWGVFPLIPQCVTFHTPSFDFLIIEQFQIVTASTWSLAQDKSGWLFSQFYIHRLRRTEAHDPLKQAQSQTQLVVAVHSEACAQGWGSLNLLKLLQKFFSLRRNFFKTNLYNSVDKEARQTKETSRKKRRSTKKCRNEGWNSDMSEDNRSFITALKELKFHNKESTDLLVKNGAKQENFHKDQQRLECGNIGNRKCLSVE